MTNPTQKPKATYYYKLFRVKRSSGKVTTVSVDTLLFTQAVVAMGGLRPVAVLAREAALKYEEGLHKSCSGFVSMCLRDAISAAPRGVPNRMGQAVAA
ncbi:hypothetical protein LC612_23085 [Nostoc sp. CHAB 5834]|nr:hypothetical protein [Nostoc sp. CHAB 5834]